MKTIQFFSVAVLLTAVLIGSLLATTDEQLGSITGHIDPAESHAIIEARYYGETVASVEADPQTGAFTIDGLPAATYDIVITPQAEGYESFTLQDVVVNEGETLDLGEISL